MKTEFGPLEFYSADYLETPLDWWCTNGSDEFIVCGGPVFRKYEVSHTDRIYFCMSTKYVPRAVKGTFEGSFAVSRAIDDWLSNADVRVGDSVWWWVEHA